MLQTEHGYQLAQNFTSQELILIVLKLPLELDMLIAIRLIILHVVNNLQFCLVLTEEMNILFQQEEQLQNYFVVARI